MPLAPTSKSACIIVVAALLLAGTSGRARAAGAEPSEPARTEARALMQQGARQMDDRQYDKAVESFREAYRLVASPKVLYNLGIAYLSVARYADALAALERFLAEATDVPAATQETARRHVDDLRAKVVALDIKSDRPGAQLTLDGRDLGAVTFDHALTIDPGPHVLRARAGEAAVEEAFTAQAGQRMTLALTFAAAAPPAVPAAPAPAVTAAPPFEVLAGPGPAPTRRRWLWAGVGGAVVVGVAVALVIALSHTDYPAVDAKVPGP